MLDNDAEGCVSARASNHRVKSVRACHPLTRSAGPGTGGGGGIACFDDDFEAAFASMLSLRARGERWLRLVLHQAHTSF